MASLPPSRCFEGLNSVPENHPHAKPSAVGVSFSSFSSRKSSFYNRLIPPYSFSDITIRISAEHQKNKFSTIDRRHGLKPLSFAVVIYTIEPNNL